MTQKIKKVQKNPMMFPIILMGILFLLWFLMMVFLFWIFPSFDLEARENSCNKIGFENYISAGGIEYCEDEEDNLHYVKIKCEGGFVHVDCKAKPIKVGEVYGTKG